MTPGTIGTSMPAARAAAPAGPFAEVACRGRVAVARGVTPPGPSPVFAPVAVGFRVVVDGAEVAWPTRRAAELVQLLALAEGHRLPRDEAIDALWPTLGADAGAANLRKAAHHARGALGDPPACGGHRTGG